MIQSLAEWKFGSRHVQKNKTKRNYIFHTIKKTISVTLIRNSTQTRVTTNNQRLANAGEDFFFAYLMNKIFGGL